MTARSLLAIACLTLFASSAVTPASATAAVPVETSTTLTVSPTSGDSATYFNVQATVSPVPDSGQVRLSYWTAGAGGIREWDYLFDVDGSGVARIPGGAQVESGDHWWQAEYLGNPNFSPSTSERKRISVTGLPTAIHDVSISWGSSAITFTGRGDRSGGAIELVVDDAVHASCIQWSTSGATCSATNNLDPGRHVAWLRFVPRDKSYGPSTSPAVTYWNGGALPPDSGILIKGGRFSTRSLAVAIDVAPSDAGGQPVTEVRISNTPAVDGAGLLADGTTFAYAPSLDWSLLAGVDGHRKVWAQLIRADGTASLPYTDTIYHDTTPPSGTFVINADDETLGDPWSGTIYEQRLTGSVSDASLKEGGGVTHVAFSNDGRFFRVGTYDWPASGFDDWWMVTHGWGAPHPIEPGMKTVYAKWRDAAGNWSPVVTDTIFLLTDQNAGRVLVDGEATYAPNPAYRSSTTVTLTIDCPFPPPDGLNRVRIGNQIEDSPTRSYAWPAGETSITIPWSLTDPSAGYTSADGVKNIHVELITNAGGHRDFGARVILDRAVPTSKTPVPGFALHTTVEAATASGLTTSAATNVEISADIQWTGSDTTGIGEFELERLLNGAWTDVALNKPNATMARQSVSEGSSNRFRVKATDLAGNTGAWRNGPRFRATAVQENASPVVYSGTWQTESRADALGGTLRYATAAGSSVRMRFEGRAIAWVAPRSSPGAMADVYVDGRRIKSVFLSASTYEPRRIVFSMSWKKKGWHTIRIVKKSSSYALRTDGFLVLI